MIEAKQLTYTYPKSLAPAVKDINITIKPGEVFGFLGPSGSGKTTMQKILIGLLKGYRGEVNILGYDLRHLKRDYYNEIGVSFELPHHFNKLTAMENLNYFASLFQKVVMEPMDVMEELGLHESADIPVGRFSKGMKNCLSLARALIHNPTIFFLMNLAPGWTQFMSVKLKKSFYHCAQEARLSS